MVPSEKHGSHDNKIWENPRKSNKLCYNCYLKTLKRTLQSSAKFSSVFLNNNYSITN